jgi:hypothetical protein
MRSAVTARYCGEPAADSSVLSEPNRGQSSIVNPLHPQFSLKWVVTGPDAYPFDARLKNYRLKQAS